MNTQPQLRSASAEELNDRIDRPQHEQPSGRFRYSNYRACRRGQPAVHIVLKDDVPVSPPADSFYGKFRLSVRLSPD